MTSAAEIEEAAAQWLVRRDADGWSDADRAAFDAWLSQDTAHRIAVIRLEAVWQKAERLRASSVGSRMGSSQMPDVTEAGPDAHAALAGARDPVRAVLSHRRWLWSAAVAASLALISVPLYQLMRPAESYATAVGGFQHLPLADGSRIDLNTNSRLTVAYSPDVRRLELEQGEAFFDVAKNPQRPFVVHVGGHRVTAVGTAFIIRRRGAGLEVVVTEGRVRIDALPLSGGGARPTFASAGQGAVVTDGASVVRPLADGAVDQALGWRDGLLIFENRSLGEVVAEFNRYNRVQMAVDPSATSVIVDGSFRASNVQGFLRLLDQGFGVRSERGAASELILKKI